MKKFSYIVGNPPYQQETEHKETKNGQVRVKSIFHLFQEGVQKVADHTLLIYPAGRWIHRSGKGMAKFGLEQINDPHLKTVVFYPDANEIFPQAGIADGVSIVSKDMKKSTGGFTYTYVKASTTISEEVDNPGEELLPLDPRDYVIVSKIKRFVEKHSLQYLHDSVLSQKFFGIESDFVEKHPDDVLPLESADDVDFTKYIKLFANDKAGKAGRSRWYLVNPAFIEEDKRKYIYEWQVVVSSANAGGQKRDNQLEIVDNHSAFGRSRVGLKSFKTEQEARHFYDYCKSYFVRFAFLMTDEALSSFAKTVPDFADYSDANRFLNWDMDIDSQMVKLLKLTNSEFSYIKDRVNSIRK